MLGGHRTPPSHIEGSTIPPQVCAVVVVPSQELATQVHSVFELVSRGTGVSAGMVCGQLPLEGERAMLCNREAILPCSKVDVVIATPGRLVEHLDRYEKWTLI